MTRLTTVQNNLSAGEIDPKLLGQSSIKAYEQGAKRLRNWQRMAQGGIERRYGTYDLEAMAARSRLAEFEFSSTQRYILGFSAATVEIFDLNGTLLQTIGSCPWDADQAFELTYTQLGDTMVIAHEAFATRLLVRTGATSFALSSLAFEQSQDSLLVYQPYYKFAAEEVTMTPSAATGAITLTASATTAWGGFVADHVGTRFRIYDAEVEITAVTSTALADATVKGTLRGKYSLDPFKTTNGSTTVEVLHVYHGLSSGSTITISGANDTAGITAANLNGARVITVIDEHRYSFPAGGAATESADGGGTNVEFSIAGAPTRDWKEQSISAVRGYPAACAFHEGRLWLGGTPDQPDGHWSSSALGYFRFDVGKGYDGDSVQGASGTEDVSSVRHLVSNGELQIFTALREAVFITRDGEPITPGNQRVKGQSGAGSGPVQPVLFDGATLFVQESGLSVSELSYSQQQGGYVAIPVSTLASHLIGSPTSAAVSQGLSSRAEQLAFFSNADGTLAVFHSLRNENIAGWMLWELGEGTIESVAAIGPYVFFCVSVRGAYRLYRQASEELISLDGAVLHTSATEETIWTLDARVRSRTVSIVSEKGYHGEVEVPADGVIELDIAVLNVVAGDAFYPIFETLPPIVALPSGERTRLIKRLVRTVLELKDVSNLSVDGKPIVLLNAGDEWQDAVEPFTGAWEVRHLGFARSPTTVISQSAPLPATILGFTQEVKV